MKIIPGRLIFLLLALCFTSPLFSQAFINRLYGTYGSESGKAGAIAADSSIYALGTSSAFTGLSSQIYLIKTDKYGALLWSKFYGGTGVDDATDMYYQDTCIYLVACSYTGPQKGYDIKVVKTDASGTLKWEKTFGTTDWDIPKKIFPINDTTFAVCGQTYGNTMGLADGMLFAFSNEGDSLWFKNMGDSYNNGFYDLQKKNADTLVACGESYVNDTTRKGWIYEMDLNTLSGESFFYGTDFNYTFNAMDRMNSGHYLIGFTTDSAGTESAQNMSMLNMDQNSHEVVYVVDMIIPGDEQCIDVMVAGNSFNILGITTSFGLGGYDAVIYRFDTIGTYLMGNTYGTADDNFGADLVLNYHNSFLVVGTSPNVYGPEDLWLFNADGAMFVSPVPVGNFDINNVEDLNAVLSDVKVYPNPNMSGLLYVQSPVPLQRIDLFDQSGRVVRSYSQNLASIDLSGTAAGFYLVHIIDADGNQGIRRLVVR